MYVRVDPMNVLNPMDFWATPTIRKFRWPDTPPEKPSLLRDPSGFSDDSIIFPLE